MRILVLSDTHGRLGKAYDVLEKLKNIDMVIHCGDHKEDGQELAEVLRVPVVSVRGNCDGPGDDVEVVETEYGDILVSHGHHHGVDYGYEEIAEFAEYSGCIAVCCGHTHVPEVKKIGDITVVNPGSLSRPRDGSNGSVAILTIDEKNFYANIVYYDTLFSGRGGDAPKGGYLRGLINYSDGF